MKLIHFILCIIGGFVLLHLVVYCNLYFSFKESNREVQIMRCKEEYLSAFEGIVQTIDFNTNEERWRSRYLEIDIDRTDTMRGSEFFKYEKKEQPELVYLVEVGQTIIKTARDSTFTLILDNGEEHKFLMPNCN